MKKFICLLLACLMALCLVATGCGDKTTGEPTEAPKASPVPTDQGIIIATQAPETSPTAEPTPGMQYQDLLAASELKYYSASSVESEFTSAALGPELCFDDNDETRWSSVFYDVEDAWICVQFAYPVIINGIEVYENTTWGQLLDWEAQYWSEEKQEWITVYEDISVYAGDYYEFDKNTEPTYAFRMHFLAGTGITITINEIDVYGLTVEVPEGTEPRKPIDFRHPLLDTPDTVTEIKGEWIFSASTSEEADGVAVLPPELAFDDNDSTRWSTAFHDLPGGWIAVDFQKEETVKGFVVNECTSWGFVTEYSVQIMENGEWKTVFEGESFTYNKYESFAKEVKTSQIRFLFEAGETESGTVTIFEINFYN